MATDPKSFVAQNEKSGMAAALRAYTGWMDGDGVELTQDVWEAILDLALNGFEMRYGTENFEQFL